MIFVTDRTEEDVLLGTEKGQYTPADLNRVESNVETLARMLKDLGIHFSPETKTDWSRADLWMSRAHSRRYIDNVESLAILANLSACLPRNIDTLDIGCANEIEMILQMVHDRIAAVTGAFHYSGEFFAGEE